ncbi:hypothetical protein [Comamonas terrae]|uniref:Uncharacterized protein n=1 Tax=Comamonas terrae TaxID=673548 RepID=A0ABW5UQT3_9BURK|nr:hypothetical protein [Comamonas terrae]
MSSGAAESRKSQNENQSNVTDGFGFPQPRPRHENMHKLPTAKATVRVPASLINASLAAILVPRLRAGHQQNLQAVGYRQGEPVLG